VSLSKDGGESRARESSPIVKEIRERKAGNCLELENEGLMEMPGSN
jgi:hypothetical protein